MKKLMAVTMVLGVVALTACGDSDGGSPCEIGSLGCACTTGGGCDPGLVCESTVCVTPDAGPGVDAGPGADAGPGVDAGPGADAGQCVDAGSDAGVPPPSCGDGVVDFADGEQCDDDNTVDGDG